MPECTGKVRYNTKGQAQDAKLRSSSVSGLRLYVYECSQCGGHHLTRMPPEVARGLKRAAVTGDYYAKEEIMTSPVHEYKYWISENAVETFRENAGLAGTKETLAVHLDEQIHAAIQQERTAIVIDANAPNEDTRLVYLGTPEGGSRKLVVVMRMHSPNTYPQVRTVGGPQGRAPLAITVLRGETASSNIATGRWKVPNRPLADKLANVKLPEVVLINPLSQDKPLSSHDLRQAIPVVKTTPMERTNDGRRATDRRDEPKPARGGTTQERQSFVENILKDRPNIPHDGPDGICELVRHKFGTGMGRELFKQIKDRLREKQELERLRAQSTQTQPTGTLLHPPLQVAPSLAKAMAKSESPATSPIQERLMAALECERRAKAAQTEAHDALAKADMNLATAKVAVERLWDELRNS